MKTAEDILKEKGYDIISVAVEATVFEALGVMTQHNIGAILVKDGDKYVGIWTERDLMRNTVDENFDPKTARVKDHMVTNLRCAPPNDPVDRLMDKFLGMRLRHLLIEKNGDYVGVLSSGDVIKAYLHQKSQELKELNKMVSFEYYDNWQWKKKFGHKPDTPGQPVKEF